MTVLSVSAKRTLATVSKWNYIHFILNKWPQMFIALWTLLLFFAELQAGLSRIQYLLRLNLSSSSHVMSSGSDKASLTLSHAAVVSFINLLRTIPIWRPSGLLCVLLITWFSRRTTFESASKVERLLAKHGSCQDFRVRYTRPFHHPISAKTVQLDRRRKFCGLNGGR